MYYVVSLLLQICPTGGAILRRGKARFLRKGDSKGKWLITTILYVYIRVVAWS